MRVFVSNALSLSMLDRDEQGGTPRGYCPVIHDLPGRAARIPRPVRDTETVRLMLADWDASSQETGAEIYGIVGHADTARVVNDLLGIDIPHSRVGVRLGHEDILLVAQIVAKDGSPYRLPEGSTRLPDDAAIEWWIV